MRFLRGSIIPNEDRDIPLLRHVVQATIITPVHLFTLLNADGIESKDRNFRNRLSRLKRKELLESQALPVSNAPSGYRITSAGSQWLIDRGELYAQHFNEIGTARRAAHWLALTRLRIALRRAGILGHWLSQVEIQYQNLLQSEAFAILYDAVVTLHTPIGGIKIGLLYESSLRTAAAYKQLENALMAEWQLHWILYLAPEPHAAHWLRQQFTPNEKCVGIAMMEDFQKKLLATPTYFVGTGQFFPLVELLRKHARPRFDFDVA